MGKLNHAVLNNYSKYRELLDCQKLTQGHGISVSQFKGTSKTWKWHRMSVEHPESVPEMELVTEVREDDLGNFKFKLRAAGFMGEPLINYDARGLAHRNPTDRGLAEQIVTTPHFNCYDDRGRRIAYKTAPLSDVATASQLSDISQCVIHFYEHCNITHDPAGYPSVHVVHPAATLQLFPAPSTTDPHAYVVRFT